MKRNKSSSSVSRWENLDHKLLVKIFSMLSIMDLINSVSRVCLQWRAACRDPELWKAVDLTDLKSRDFETPKEAFAWTENEESQERLSDILTEATELSGKYVTKLYFNFWVFVRAEDLELAVERLWNIRKLALPAWNSINANAFNKACCRWHNLETLIIPCFNEPIPEMGEIGRHCRNFSNLKLMTTFTARCAKAIVICLKNLKVLSLRCAVVYTGAVNFVINHAHNLKVLNLSHCIFRDYVVRDKSTRFYRTPDPAFVRKASKKLEKLLLCLKDDCPICERGFSGDESDLRSEFKEEYWREDEVAELAF